MVSSIIESLTQEITGEQLSHIVYCYCRYNDNQKNTLVSVLRTLLLQLFNLRSNDPVVWNELDRLRQEAILDHATTDSLPSLTHPLTKVTGQISALRCVIDDLDELKEPGELV